MTEATMTAVDQLLNSFQKYCDNSSQTYYKAIELNNQHPEAFTDTMLDMIVEHIIVNLFSNWEKFLEETFIEYMLGNMSANGIPANRYVFPTDAAHAYRLIQNVNQYPDWSDVDKVLVNAQNFFQNGGPFMILSTLKSELKALRRIRNAIAHVSIRARKEFENLVQNRVGYLPEGITPAKFLIEYKSGKKKSDPTYCVFYIEYLRNTAEMIAVYSQEQANPNPN